MWQRSPSVDSFNTRHQAVHQQWASMAKCISEYRIAMGKQLEKGVRPLQLRRHLAVHCWKLDAGLGGSWFDSTSFFLSYENWIPLYSSPLPAMPHMAEKQWRLLVFCSVRGSKLKCGIIYSIYRKPNHELDVVHTHTHISEIACISKPQKQGGAANLWDTGLLYFYMNGIWCGFVVWMCCKPSWV